MQDRVPQNLVGDNYRTGRKFADNTNQAMINDKMSTYSGGMSQSITFPKTSN